MQPMPIPPGPHFQASTAQPHLIADPRLRTCSEVGTLASYIRESRKAPPPSCLAVVAAFVPLKNQSLSLNDAANSLTSRVLAATACSDFVGTR